MSTFHLRMSPISKMAFTFNLVHTFSISYLLINDMISDIMTDKLMLCCDDLGVGNDVSFWGKIKIGIPEYLE